MAYVRPHTINQPLGRYRHVQTLHDGGEFKPGDPWSGWCLVECEWDGDPCLGLRWNQSHMEPKLNLGFPLLRTGLPGMVVVPDMFAPGMRQKVADYYAEKMKEG